MSVRWAQIETAELIELWGGLGSSADEGMTYDGVLAERLENELEAVLRERGVNPYELSHPMEPKR